MTTDEQNKLDAQQLAMLQKYDRELIMLMGKYKPHADLMIVLAETLYVASLISLEGFGPDIGMKLIQMAHEKAVLEFRKEDEDDTDDEE